MHLSDIFRFTQAFGQKGHQIGRKVGDAIELLTMGMIYQEPNLLQHLVVEDGLEGATSAKHKVEFSFYNLDDKGKPTKKINDLFGFVECKKVGVESTIKQNFKKWLSVKENRTYFHLTKGYSFSLNPKGNFSWQISLSSHHETPHSITLKLKKTDGEGNLIAETEHLYEVKEGDNIIVALDVENILHILGPTESLHSLDNSISKCIITNIIKLEDDGISSILVNECLTGPQTPEKAKQASFVSLDVRKKVLGRFDKTAEDNSLTSILVIGEASHWDTKSRAMIRLCNDYNLMIPDKVIIDLFETFLEKFGDGYQDKITKTAYKNSDVVKDKVRQVIDKFNCRILEDMDSNIFYRFNIKTTDEGAKQLILEQLN